MLLVRAVDLLKAELGSIVDDSPVTLQAYARDATPEFAHLPEAVISARSTSDVARVIAIAREHEVPVVARGGGSNLCAATVPLRGGIVLSLSSMQQIKEISTSEMLAVVEPGVTTAALDNAAAQHGLLFPPDPGSRVVSTIGGNIATCAGGLRGLKYGVTRNYVLGLEVVLGTGEVIRTGSRLVKDVAGYDLTRLITGSEGTLGIITEATVALRPRPTAAHFGLAYFDALASASAAVEAVVAAGILPATLEFLDRTCIRSVEEYAHLGLDVEAGAMLLFGDDGDEVSARRSTDAMAEIIRSASGLRGITLAGSAVESEALLEARRCSLPSLARMGSLCILEDISVPRPALAEAVLRIGEVARRHGLVIGTFGHAGDGNLHPTIVVDGNDSMQVAAAHRALDEIFHIALDLGGTITGEHGVGAAKLPYLEARLGAAQIDLLRRIKSACDPAGILNPGKLGS